MDKMQKSLISKFEGHFDVRAPLATFDTIDLGEDVSITRPSKLTSTEAVEENVGECSNDTTENDDCNKSLKPDSLHVYDTVDSTSAGHKYQKLGEGNNDLKQGKSNHDHYMTTQTSPDSFSDSSDSDNSYIQSGYISVNDGKVTCTTKKDYQQSHLTSPFPNRYTRLSDQERSLDSTPISSPCLPRSPLPVLLQELENVKFESKRKALEKRIQRLQVTNTPVERPRSTTPINVVTLEEYKEISSPDKIQQESLEKLKIKLPQEEICYKQKSPWKIKGGLSEPHVFNFSEENLFTHTKSALIIQKDGSLGQSPKRILIPPCLSPALSPANSPARLSTVNDVSSCVSPTNSPKYYFIPSTNTPILKPPNSLCSPHVSPRSSNVSGLVHPNWVAFDDEKADTVDGSKTSAKCSDTNFQNPSSIEIGEGLDSKLPEKPIGRQFNNRIAEADISVVNTDSVNIFKQKVRNVLEQEENDEVLTINIEELNGNKVCNIEVGGCKTSTNVNALSGKNTGNAQQNIDSGVMRETDNKTRETEEIDWSEKSDKKEVLLESQSVQTETIDGNIVSTLCESTVLTKNLPNTCKDFSDTNCKNVEEVTSVKVPKLQQTDNTILSGKIDAASTKTLPTEINGRSNTVQKVDNKTLEANQIPMSTAGKDLTPINQ